MTETEKIIRLVEEAARPGEDEVLAAYISDWLGGEKRRQMLVGQRYYENRGDILSRCRQVIGRDGALLEDRSLPAARIAHGFVRKLVDQKAQYLFGRPFTVRAEDPVFGEKLSALFGAAERSIMRDLCKEAVNKGVGWLQIWPEETGVKLRKIPSEELLPIKDENGQLEMMLHIYPIEVFSGKKRVKLLKVRCWKKEGVQDYCYKDGKLQKEGGLMPHLTVDGEPVLLTELPFVPFRYNEEELPLIRFVKPLIDDYDRLKSQDTDDLSETSGAVMVLQNYDGTDLGEFRENLARYRAVKVSDGGGLTILRQPVHTAELMQHLQQDRRDLYEIGRGVDTQNERLGNASGVMMRFLYADLDLDCAGIESSFAAGFEAVCRLAAVYWALMGEGDHIGKKAEIILNRDIIISESDAIEQCVQSMGMLSKETVIENHPWVVDAAAEMRRLRKEANGDETAL